MWREKLKKVERDLAADDLSSKQKKVLESKQRSLVRKCARYARHEKMLEVQRLYAKSLDERILSDTRFAVLYEDFGAYYDILGDKVIDLVLAARAQDEFGGFRWTILHNFCRNEEFLSEDCYTVRDVWLHHLRNSGELDKWDHLVIVRDGGAHFQNNRTAYLESCMTDLMKDRRSFTYEVSALAKRHGYNIADSAISRVSAVSRKLAIAGIPPILASQWADVVNESDRFENTRAYFFDDIDRNPENFPADLKEFSGIQKYCQFLYSHKNQYGEEVREPGYVRARVVSTSGKFTFHDFLQKYRPVEWGALCSDCSQIHQRPIYHFKEGEIVRAENCVRKGRRSGAGNRRPTSGLIQPDSGRMDRSKQPGPKRKQPDLGPDAVTCPFCPKQCKNSRGLKRHVNCAHPGEVIEPPAESAQSAAEASEPPAIAAAEPPATAASAASEPPAEAGNDNSDNDSVQKSRRGRSRPVVSSSESEVSSISSDSDLGIDSDGEPYYEVGKLLKRRKRGRRVEYLVQWKPIDQWPDPTWEDSSSLLSCPEVVDAFNKNNK